MLSLDYVANKLNLTTNELKLYINRACIKPCKFQRNSEIIYYLNNDMIKIIKNLVNSDKLSK